MERIGVGSVTTTTQIMKCVDCITGIMSTNKIVHKLLSRIICVVFVIEHTPIHCIAYIHHPAAPTNLMNFKIFFTLLKF
jgi:hypothetical protein